MRTTNPVFRCDVPDCRSVCTLTAAMEPDADAELTKRGWKVAPPVYDRGDKLVKAVQHICPGCVALGKSPA